jgi:hypothetical protein
MALRILPFKLDRDWLVAHFRFLRPRRLLRTSVCARGNVLSRLCFATHDAEPMGDARSVISATHAGPLRAWRGASAAQERRNANVALDGARRRASGRLL